MIIRGKAYLKEGVKKVSIHVEDGFIKDIRLDHNVSGDEVYDYNDKDLLILPGMVDIHVHMRDFDYSYKEDFYTGTSAAAAGGVAVVVDMPNTKPRVNTLRMLWYRDCVASINSVVDYGLYYGVPSNSSELEGYEETAIGMKFFPEDLEVDVDLLSRILRYNAEKNIFTVFHPEDPGFVKNGFRPPEAEVKAAVDIARLSVKYGFRAHLTHVSTIESIDAAKKIDPSISSDTCPHYLTLSNELYRESYYRVYPPLRPEDMRRSLLRYFVSGYVEALTTDHAPHEAEEKFWETPWGGFPGLETALPILLTLCKKGVLTLDRIVEAYSRCPARLIGFDKLLGDIEVGKLGNFTVVNLGSSYKIDPSYFHSKAKHSPFEGWEVHGKVIATFVRGVPVYLDGEITAPRGYGENIMRLWR